VLRAVREAITGRAAGPILRTRTGRRVDTRRSHPGPDPGRPRRRHHPPDQPGRPAPRLCTTGLVAGTSTRDLQHAMGHANPRTTMRYDMAKANLDRHAAHAAGAYLAGVSTG
jgi:integrase/recombinase XerD